MSIRPIDPSVRSETPFSSCTRADAGGDEIVVAVQGELDLTTSGLLRRVLESAHELGRPLVVDLAGVGFLDSSGVHELLHARERGPLRVVDPQPAARRCLELLGVLDLLEPSPAGRVDGYAPAG